MCSTSRPPSPSARRGLLTRTVGDAHGGPLVLDPLVALGQPPPARLHQVRHHHGRGPAPRALKTQHTRSSPHAVRLATQLPPSSARRGAACLPAAGPGVTGGGTPRVAVGGRGDAQPAPQAQRPGKRTWRRRSCSAPGSWCRGSCASPLRTQSVCRGEQPRRGETRAAPFLHLQRQGLKKKSMSSCVLGCALAPRAAPSGPAAHR